MAESIISVNINLKGSSIVQRVISENLENLKTRRNNFESTLKSLEHQATEFKKHWMEGQEGMELEEGDAVQTGNDSSAEITFLDGTTIELEADTEIEITSVDVSTGTGDTTVTITQTIGTVITRMTQILDSASNYETVTASGVTSVRARPANPATAVIGVTGNGTTWVVNQGGDVRTEAHSVELLIPQGQRGLIVLGLPPELMPPNLPPLAQDDAFGTAEHLPVILTRPGVLFNDFDPDVYDLQMDHMMHGTLFPKPHEIIHVENLGGDIDQVLNRRVLIGCFPLKIIGGSQLLAEL